MTYVTEEQRSRTGWIVCQMLVEILADGTSAMARPIGGSDTRSSLRPRPWTTSADLTLEFSAPFGHAPFQLAQELRPLHPQAARQGLLVGAEQSIVGVVAQKA